MGNIQNFEKTIRQRAINKAIEKNEELKSKQFLIIKLKGKSCKIYLTPDKLEEYQNKAKRENTSIEAIAEAKYNKKPEITPREIFNENQLKNFIKDNNIDLSIFPQKWKLKQLNLAAKILTKFPNVSFVSKALNIDYYKLYRVFQKIKK